LKQAKSEVRHLGLAAVTVVDRMIAKILIRLDMAVVRTFPLLIYIFLAETCRQGLLDELLAAEWQPADENIRKMIAKLFILQESRERYLPS